VGLESSVFQKELAEGEGEPKRILRGGVGVHRRACLKFRREREFYYVVGDPQSDRRNDPEKLINRFGKCEVVGRAFIFLRRAAESLYLAGIKRCLSKKLGGKKFPEGLRSQRTLIQFCRALGMHHNLNFFSGLRTWSPWGGASAKKFPS